MEGLRHTLKLADGQRGRLSKFRARHATRLRETEPVELAAARGDD